MERQIKAALTVWHNLDNEEAIRWGAVEAFERIIMTATEAQLAQLVTQRILRVAVWTHQVFGQVTLKEVYTDRTGEVAVERQRMTVRTAGANHLLPVYRTTLQAVRDAITAQQLAA